MRLKPFAIAIFGCSAFSASAAIEQIYNYGGLEFVRSGNAHHVHPATPESTRIRGGWVLEISDIEPKAVAKTDLPYTNKGGALAKVTVTPSIDPKKVSASAASKIKDAAKSAGANPYLAIASFACAVYCDALMDWGIEKLKNNGDGTFSALAPDQSTPVHQSDGYLWSNGGRTSIDPNSLCAAYIDQGPLGHANLSGILWHSSTSGTCQYQGQLATVNGDGVARTTIASGCSAGSPIVGGVCNGPVPTQEIPLQTYIDSRYTGKGWDNHWAKMTAQIIKDKGNVFTDGTSVGITGPAIVPVSVSETKTGVKVLPGTTTIAPSTHTGPTDSGTQTTTTTTSANNKFNPGPFSSSGSGSSGGPATGPSMTTTQTTTTTTSVTNNITNVTNITNEATTETEEAPEEAPTDTPFADLPELYKQKYPDGLIGVLRTQFTAMKATPLFSLPAQLMGDLPQTGQCPSWQLNLNFAAWANFGTSNIGADCSIWDFASWVVIISALILARQLVFGG